MSAQHEGLGLLGIRDLPDAEDNTIGILIPACCFKAYPAVFWVNLEFFYCSGIPYYGIIYFVPFPQKKEILLRFPVEITLTLSAS